MPFPEKEKLESPTKKEPLSVKVFDVGFVPLKVMVAFTPCERGMKYNKQQQKQKKTNRD